MVSTELSSFILVSELPIDGSLLRVSLDLPCIYFDVHEAGRGNSPGREPIPLGPTRC